MAHKRGFLRINPKKFGNVARPCTKEMISFLNCMCQNQLSDENCARQKELLTTCLDAESKKKKFGSINYQLQKLSKK